MDSQPDHYSSPGSSSESEAEEPVPTPLTSQTTASPFANFAASGSSDAPPTKRGRGRPRKVQPVPPSLPRPPPPPPIRAPEPDYLGVLRHRFTASVDIKLDFRGGGRRDRILDRYRQRLVALHIYIQSVSFGYVRIYHRLLEYKHAYNKHG
jgi:hypothetical protein